MPTKPRFAAPYLANLYAHNRFKITDTFKIGPLNTPRRITAAAAVAVFGVVAASCLYTTGSKIDCHAAAGVSNTAAANRPKYPYVCEPITPELANLDPRALVDPKTGSKFSMRQRMESLVMQVQCDIVNAIEAVDGGRFLIDKWERDIQAEGGGVTCMLQDSTLFEKAGVNVSVVSGVLPPEAVRQMNSRGKHLDTKKPVRFFATGISLVMHPKNPHAPTVHCNYRYFEIPNDEIPNEPLEWWFGGGADLTPMYLDEDDAIHFHRVLKSACDEHDPVYYPAFKKWCDEYFFLPHRGEARGIGGIFFDDLNNKPALELFAFVSECANSFVSGYLPIIKKNVLRPFSPENKHWQQLRRGRYVEFNLIHDRGTKFGLASPTARTESILMSLPLTARWEYMSIPTPGSPEEALVNALKTPRDWVN